MLDLNDKAKTDFWVKFGKKWPLTSMSGVNFFAKFQKRLYRIIFIVKLLVFANFGPIQANQFWIISKNVCNMMVYQMLKMSTICLLTSNQLPPGHSLNFFRNFKKKIFLLSRHVKSLGKCVLVMITSIWPLFYHLAHTLIERSLSFIGIFRIQITMTSYPPPLLA